LFIDLLLLSVIVGWFGDWVVGWFDGWFVGWFDVDQVFEFII